MAAKFTAKAQNAETRQQDSAEQSPGRLRKLLTEGEGATYLTLILFSSLFAIATFIFSSIHSGKESGFQWFLRIAGSFFVVAVLISLVRRASTYGKPRRDKPEAKRKKYNWPGLIVSIFLGISTPALQKLFDIGFKNLPPDVVAQAVDKAVDSNDELCDAPSNEGLPNRIISVLEDEKSKLESLIQEPPGKETDPNKKEADRISFYRDDFKEYFTDGNEDELEKKLETLFEMVRGECVNDNTLEGIMGISTRLGFLSFLNLAVLALFILTMALILLIHAFARYPGNIIGQISDCTWVCMVSSIAALIVLALLLSPGMKVPDGWQLFFIMVTAFVTSIAAFRLSFDLDELIKGERKGQRRDAAAKPPKRQGLQRKQEENAHAVEVSESKGIFAYKKWVRRFLLTHLLVALIAIIYASIRWIAPIQSCDQVNDSTSSVR